MDGRRKDDLDYALLSYLELKERGERARRGTAETIRQLHVTYSMLEAIWDRIDQRYAEMRMAVLASVPDRTDGDRGEG